MANIRKKAESYTPPANYQDMDGNWRNFTYIDHDKKLNVATGKLSPEELEDLQKTIERTKNEDIAEILAMPAVSFLKSGNSFAEDYIIRDTEKGIIWNEKVVKDALTINSNMRSMVKMMVWKYTVREQFWFEDMSHEDILAGKWKDWM